MPVQQGVMSTYQLTAHNHSGVGQGGLVDPTVINHDALLNFVGAEHLSLPNTLVNVLTDHNKIAHDALLIDADTCDLQHLGTGATVEFVKLVLNQPGGGSNLELVAGPGNIPAVIFVENAANRALLQYDSGLNELDLQALTENADIHIAPNGTGKVKFGTHVGLGGETVTGYINIKDSAGNARKLAVVS